MNHGLETRGPTPASGALVGLLQGQGRFTEHSVSRPLPRDRAEEERSGVYP